MTAAPQAPVVCILDSGTNEAGAEGWNYLTGNEDLTDEAAAVSDSLSAVFSVFLLAFFPFPDVVLTAAIFVSSASRDCVPVVCVM